MVAPSVIVPVPLVGINWKSLTGGQANALFWTAMEVLSPERCSCGSVVGLRDYCPCSKSQTCFEDYWGFIAKVELVVSKVADPVPVPERAPEEVTKPNPLDGWQVQRDVKWRDFDTYGREKYEAPSGHVVERVTQLVPLLNQLPGGRIVSPGDGNGAVLIACQLLGRHCVSSDIAPTMKSIRKMSWEHAVGHLRENDIVVVSYAAEFFGNFASWVSKRVAKEPGKKGNRGNWLGRIIVIGDAPIFGSAFNSFTMSHDGRVAVKNLDLVESFQVVTVDSRFFRSACIVNSAYITSFKLINWVRMLAIMGSLTSCKFDFPMARMAEKLTGLVEGPSPEYQIISKFGDLVPEGPAKAFDVRTGQVIDVRYPRGTPLKLVEIISISPYEIYEIDVQNLKVIGSLVSTESYHGRTYLWLNSLKTLPPSFILRGEWVAGMIDCTVKIKKKVTSSF
jgi:hypothetical protein